MIVAMMVETKEMKGNKALEPLNDMAVTGGLLALTRMADKTGQ